MGKAVQSKHVNSLLHNSWIWGGKIRDIFKTDLRLNYFTLNYPCMLYKYSLQPVDRSTLVEKNLAHLAVYNRDFCARNP